MSARELQLMAFSALLAGTSRQPIDLSRLLGGAIPPGDPKADLKALALTGQALRFERPAAPGGYTAIQPRVPTRRNLPDALRPIFVRLFGDGKSSIAPASDLALGIALALERLRVQPHPFDFPRLDGFLRVHAERLGPDACAWVDRDKTADEKRGYFDAEILDDGNWHEATPARRQLYVEDRRRRDADAARALVETVWPNEGADLRLKLLQALRVGLAPADAPFLDGLAKDRAPRVRELAERYRSRLPGAAGENPALNAVMSRIVRGQSGLLRKRPTLKLELPATVIGDGWRLWVAQAFEDVELEELSAALGLMPAEMITAAAQDRCLLAAIALMAFRQGNTVIGYQACEAIPDIPTGLELQLLQSIANVEPRARQALAEFVIRKSLGAETVKAATLIQLQHVLGGPVSERLMAEILRAPLWLEALAAPNGGRFSVLASVATLCPSAKRPEFRAALTLTDPAHIAPIPQFLDMLDSLEKVSSP